METKAACQNRARSQKIKKDNTGQDAICYNCGEKEHHAQDCNDKHQKEQMDTNVMDDDGYDSNEVEHIFYQNILGILSKTWPLLEDQIQSINL